ncbi:MAG TPA: BTAD domain-containing putative transcriptional regulator [Pseudonocardiaceae bacterium]|nr:BTAD domain-containing putative transcriptional regulator [Pseudonocardiaceae bacterium]
MARDELRFAVLGPVRAWRGEEELSLGPAQRKAVLASLLLRRGQAMTAAELVDGLWGAQAPPRAIGALRTHVAALRRLLEPDRTRRAPARILVSVADGYALRVPARCVDLAVVFDQLAEARIHRDTGEPAKANELLADCLRLWHAEALTGLSGPFLAAQRVQLAERRLDALEAFLETRLELNQDPQLIPDLVALSAEHPLRERPRALLMTALARSGRHADALKVYADIQHLLADQLGLDPGPELAELHQRIRIGLHQRSRFDAETEPAAAGSATPPAQLPADLIDFTGRAELADRLVAELRAPRPAVMAICTVSGMAGAGKSALAVHVAHRLTGHFPDGQLYADLHGLADPPAGPGPVLGAFLRALGHSEAEIPSTMDDRAGLFRTALAGKRMLVVLDEALDVEQVLPLLPGTPGSAVLITSRTILAGLPATSTAQLDVFSHSDALALFTSMVGTERVRAEPAATERIITACAHLPLAVRIAAARLAARPKWSIAALAARLADERGRLAELGTAEISVADTFLPSYRALDAEQARAFRLLAGSNLPELPVSVAATILDRPPGLAERLCESLVDQGLLRSLAPGRYGYHELLRLFGRQLPDPPAAPSPAPSGAASTGSATGSSTGPSTTG